MNRVYTAYLAGPIEYSFDRGISWRLEYKDRLERLGIKCILPQDIEGNDIPSIEYLASIKETNTIEYIQHLRKIMRADILLASNADMLVVHYAGEKIGGTVAEVTMSHLLGHPNFLTTTTSIKDINGWFLSCFDAITDNLDDAIVHIKKYFKME